MKTIEEFIESGILEMYVLGMTSEEESREVIKMAASSQIIRNEIEIIIEAFKLYAQSNADSPNSTIKPIIMAAIDYEERLKKGEQPSVPPILNGNSKISDYAEWLDRKDMVMPDDFSGIHIKLIGYTPEANTAIVWLTDETPYEVHTDEHEKFLILEGTCDIDIDGNVHSLTAGNYLSIPLHAGHVVKVTSAIPCKLILQRVAA